MPNSKEEEINKAPKKSEAASERCERMKVTVDKRARQDICLEIPQHEVKYSPNVLVSMGIVVWELMIN